MKELQDVPVVIINKDGIISYTNASFTDVFGWSEEDALSKSIDIIIPEAMRDAHNMGFSRFMSTEKPKILGQSLKLPAVNNKGEEFEAEHYIIAEKIDDEWQVGASIKKI